MLAGATLDLDARLAEPALHRVEPPRLQIEPGELEQAPQPVEAIELSACERSLEERVVALDVTQTIGEAAPDRLDVSIRRACEHLAQRACLIRGHVEVGAMQDHRLPRARVV